MAYSYKTILKKNKVTYSAVKNKINSITCDVWASSNGSEVCVASYNDKTSRIKWHNTLDGKVKQRIEEYLMEKG